MDLVDLAYTDTYQPEVLVADLVPLTELLEPFDPREGDEWRERLKPSKEAKYNFFGELSKGEATSTQQGFEMFRRYVQDCEDDLDQTTQKGAAKKRLHEEFQRLEVTLAYWEKQRTIDHLLEQGDVDSAYLAAQGRLVQGRIADLVHQERQAEADRVKEQPILQIPVERITRQIVAAKVELHLHLEAPFRKGATTTIDLGLPKGLGILKGIVL